MDKEVLFGKTLENIRKQAKEQGNVISETDVRDAFSQLALNDEQLMMVYDYLKKHGVGIGEPADIEDYLDAEDQNFLELYLQELSMLEEVSDGEKEAITLSAMAGDHDAKKRLITLYLPEAVDLAKLYAGQGTIMEDLIGEANLALTTGVELLGALEHPSEVSGMLGKLMMDAMEECIAQNTQSDDIAKQVADRVNKVADAAKELSDTLLRKVTPKELAAETEIPLEEIQEALRLSAQKIDGLDGNDGNNGE